MMSAALLMVIALAASGEQYNATGVRVPRVPVAHEENLSSNGLLVCAPGTKAQIREVDLKRKLDSWDGVRAHMAGVAPPRVKKTPSSLKYPKKFLRPFQPGNVVVTMFLNEQGRVAEAFVTCSSDSLFNENALEYVRRIVFYPAMMEGKAVRSIGRQSVQFDGMAPRGQP